MMMMKNRSLTVFIFVIWATFNIRFLDAQIPEGAFPIIYTGHLYIKGSINGNDGNYVFDTGATNLYIDDLHYSDHNFKFENTVQGLLPGIGSKPQRVTVIKDTVPFKFENNLYITTKVPVLRLKPILGDIADGIIGNEYFNNSILEINYELEYMRIHSTIDAVDLKDWKRLKMVKREKRFYMSLSIVVNDTTNISGEFIIDLGSGGSVSLTSLIAHEKDLKKSIKNKVAYFTKYGGVGGESSSYDFITSSIAIGDFKFNDVVMDYSLDTKGALASKKYLGILGNKILERFDVILDFKDDCLYLRPNKNYNDPFEPSRLGFAFTNRSETLSAWIVTGLYKSLNADSAGLKIDDKIIAINETNVNDINYKLQESFFDHLDKVNLKIDRKGEIMDISFKLEPILTDTKSSKKK
jgi:hypothetical protein